MALWELPIVAAIDDEGQSLVVKFRRNGPNPQDHLVELEIYTAALQVPQTISALLSECGLSAGQVTGAVAVLNTIKGYCLQKAGYSQS